MRSHLPAMRPDPVRTNVWRSLSALESQLARRDDLKSFTWLATTRRSVAVPPVLLSSPAFLQFIHRSLSFAIPHEQGTWPLQQPSTIRECCASLREVGLTWYLGLGFYTNQWSSECVLFASMICSRTDFSISLLSGSVSDHISVYQFVS